MPRFGRYSRSYKVVTVVTLVVVVPVPDVCVVKVVELQESLTFRSDDRGNWISRGCSRSERCRRSVGYYDRSRDFADDAGRYFRVCVDYGLCADPVSATTREKTVRFTLDE
ncbi:uncharacterized protein K444DRAFT_629528 [Hyaloscypha bicolor E]|uniref:Uncharacterized protein n=1 Tax=Hyaloscypha bicolor E TaxID=1095630 RepID=A0A2J6TAP3_9HELO|nr:uncharacterized protein K444DRAFT_629528 [Hyaloscypha bicolor E]PMD60100.1 hypothetical protein K444DRAFT_629528 [Hyaloscypha bicolor E]